jgi:hypothetical protein
MPPGVVGRDDILSADRGHVQENGDDDPTGIVVA